MTTLSRRTILAGTAGAVATAALKTPAQAQAGNLTLVVPFPPGGSTDALARMIQAGWQPHSQRRIVVENKGGAAGAVGAAQVAKAPPDGSSLLVTFDSHATIPVLVPNPPLNVETDMEPVLLVGTAPYVLAASTKHPYRTLAELIAAAKAKPGSIRYGSAGPGSIGHLSMVLLGEKAGVDWVHVPYRGSGPAFNDLLGGHLDLICASAAFVTPQLGSPLIRPIVGFGETRLDAMPEVQTVAEAGYPGLEALAWWGIFAPKGTPAAITGEQAREIKEVISAPDVADKLRESQQMKLVLGGPSELRTFFERQVKTWGDVVRKNDIRM